MPIQIKKGSAQAEASHLGADSARERQEAGIRALVEEVRSKVTWIPEDDIASQVSQLMGSYRLLIDHESSIEKPSVIRARLESVSDRARNLLEAIHGLGPDALRILQGFQTDFPLRWEAGVFEFDQDVVDFDQTSQEPASWNPNVPLATRLESLAELSCAAASWVQKNCKDGGYRKRLPGASRSAEQALFHRAAEILSHWLVAPGHPSPDGRLSLDMDLFDQLLLLIGRRVHEIATEARLTVKRRTKSAVRPQGVQWGRSAAREAKAWLFGTSLRQATLQNNSKA